MNFTLLERLSWPHDPKSVAPQARDIRRMADDGRLKAKFGKTPTSDEMKAMDAVERFDANSNVVCISRGMPTPKRVLISDDAPLDVLGMVFGEEPIPPRAWLLGTTFARRFVTALLATGGTGKTALRYVQYLALATGKNLTGEHVHKRCKVLILGLEDDATEIARRLKAACKYYGITREDIGGRIIVRTAKDLNGMRFLRADDHGRLVGSGGLGDYLRELIKAENIDLASIDPFVKSHGMPENDNTSIDMVVAEVAGIAHECDCAFDLLHHTRKGTTTPGDSDAGRGASATINAARISDTLTPMTKEEAGSLCVRDPTGLIRLDNAKVNLIPKAAGARWFKLWGEELGNGTEDYPNGDNVQTVIPWKPPVIGAGLTSEIKEAILSKIEDGLPNGDRYSARPEASPERQAWRVVVELYDDVDETEAKGLIKAWVKDGVLVVRDHSGPKNKTKCLFRPSPKT